MRILVITQYFWPENFRINDLCCELVAQGHSVTVLTGEPNYPSGKKEKNYLYNPKAYADFKGCEIIRVPIIARGEGSIRLALNYLSYFTMASTLGLWRLRNRSFDVVFVCQLSPVTIALPAILYRRIYRIPVVMWVLDLWPDSLKAIGIVKSNSVLTVINKLVSYIYDRCDLVLGQSKSFVEEIKRNSTKPIVGYFPSWAENVFDTEVKDSDMMPLDNDAFNILFAGNVGEAQDFPVVIKAIELIKQRGLNAKMHIVGDGRALNWLINEIEKRDLIGYIKIWGRYPLEDMPRFYAAADALFVSLKDSPTFSMTIPGKVQSYMMASKPVLALLNGDGAEVIKESKCGLVAPSGDYNALARQIEKLLFLSDLERERMGSNGRSFAIKEFNRYKLVSRLIESFESVTAGDTK